MSETSIPRIDVPEAYEARVEIGYSELEDVEKFLQRKAEYSANQQEQVAFETEMFGISADTQPERFLEAHNSLLADMQAELNEDFSPIKQTVIERTAAYFADGDEKTHGGIADLLTQRLAATERIIVSDSLAYGRDIGGSFNTLGRQPVVTSGELIDQLHGSEDADAFHERVSKVVVAHEIMHGMLTSGAQETWLFQDHNIRNGLEVFDVDNPFEMGEMKTNVYGKWLNEATLESFRQTIMETEEVRYEPGVMVLHMLDELSPGLRDELVVAALDSAGPGPVFGKVENLLGPTAIDDVDELLANVTSFADLEPFKDAVAAMLPKELQAQGRAVLEQKQEEIFAWRPNYQEKRQKQLDEVAQAKQHS